MQGHDEEFQSRTGTAQPGRRAQLGQVATIFVGMMPVAALTTLTYNPIQPHATRWLLAYGAATYVVAILATVLLPVVGRWPIWRGGHFMSLVGLVIVWGLVALLAFPSFFGSIAIVYGLTQLFSLNMGNGEVIGGLVLEALFVFPLLWLLQRSVKRA